VRDGIDLKRMMIMVWLCTFPAMFFGMWNVGFQANTILAGTARSCWRRRTAGACADRLMAGFDPGQLVGQSDPRRGLVSADLPVTFIVGGFWEVLFASIRKHEVNEGFFVTSVLFALTLPPSTSLSGRWRWASASAW
jgi:Na+-transporting NADH:ubiquinone oxidoreductase subunit B